MTWRPPPVTCHWGMWGLKRCECLSLLQVEHMHQVGFFIHVHVFIDLSLKSSVCLLFQWRVHDCVCKIICVRVCPKHGDIPGSPLRRAGPEDCWAWPGGGWEWLCGHSRGRRAGRQAGPTPRHHLVDTGGINMLFKIKSGHMHTLFWTRLKRS